ncbi:TetR/AcrR family transcriptional regulator [Dactylosporangium matsuzakiense]|uniref:TetR family transcriptional regulator n=1 Tax=Dactylosporangium matsuzakiense TaxID=53360 RepID=A0A9W6KF92_9ACTN|nr:TetR/AcrR family transcriptional regulator [Dactylosporangium matsuzakiense]UWZ46095.1 TetR/AcrR family transcriptional regulator [Dactylosporangium matsuzakiense]GLL00228.1 TetR family transcriptional regulator [Dactylosporangium matsuzakiense]
MPPPQRADARRNYARILAVAGEAVAAKGADASLDDIAKKAGVGPGTLYRHFPTRQHLLDAVFHDRIVRLRDEAARLLDEEPDPVTALATWLRAFIRHLQQYRGLSDALKAIYDHEDQLMIESRDLLRWSVGELLSRARAAGRVRPDIDASDLLRLGHGAGMVCEPDAEGDARAERFVSLLVDGLTVRTATNP